MAGPRRGKLFDSRPSHDERQGPDQDRLDHLARPDDDLSDLFAALTREDDPLADLDREPARVDPDQWSARGEPDADRAVHAGAHAASGRGRSNAVTSSTSRALTF